LIRLEQPVQIKEELLMNIRKEVALYERAKNIDPEPMFSPKHDRSYPDKNCEWFNEGNDNGFDMRERIRELLGNKEGYAVQLDSYIGSTLKHTELPFSSHESEDSVPDFIDESSSGWIRIEDEFWEWTGDNAVCYLCKMNAKVPTEI
jgi:hypothetical protein